MSHFTNLYKVGKSKAFLIQINSLGEAAMWPVGADGSLGELAAGAISDVLLGAIQSRYPRARLDLEPNDRPHWRSGFNRWRDVAAALNSPKNNAKKRRAKEFVYYVTTANLFIINREMPSGERAYCVTDLGRLADERRDSEAARYASSDNK